MGSPGAKSFRTSEGLPSCYGAAVRWLVPLAITAAVGCARVEAHRRGTLARPDMELGAFSGLTGGEDHARAYREGSSGGARAKAGGCGCN